MAAELTLDELARLGAERYEREVKPRLTSAGHGKFVAVDVFSSAYEVSESAHLAPEATRARRPGSRSWLEGAGYPTAYAIAGGSAP